MGKINQLVGEDFDGMVRSLGKRNGSVGNKWAETSNGLRITKEAKEKCQIRYSLFLQHWTESLITNLDKIIPVPIAPNDNIDKLKTMQPVSDR